jgi:hypothetical protein
VNRNKRRAVSPPPSGALSDHLAIRGLGERRLGPVLLALLVEVQTEPRKISIDHIGRLCLGGPEETKNWAGSHMMAKRRLTNVGTGSASFRGAGG